MQNMSNQKSALGLDGNLTALIGYIVGIVALIMIFIEKDNKFVRFHAFQAVFFHATFIVIWIGSIIVIGIVTWIIGMVSGILGLISSLLYLLLFVVLIAWFGGVIYAAIKSYGGSIFKLPIVGNMAENFTNK